MSVIEQFTDVDLVVPPNGCAKGLGPVDHNYDIEEREKDKEALAALPNFGDVYSNKLIPMSEWSNYEDAHQTLRPMVPYIMNQKSEPSCASHAQVQCMQTCGRVLYGDVFPKLSALSIYHFVRVRGGGSFISTNMEQARKVGALPLDTPENKEKWPHTHVSFGENKSLPNGYQETAKYFQVEGWLRVTTPEEWFAALLGNNFINYGRDGHAIASIFPQKSRGNWVFGYANSWGQWGDGGFGYDSLGKIRNCTGYAIQSVTTFDQAEPVVLAESQSETHYA